MVSSLYSIFAVWTLEELHHRIFSEKLLKFCNQLFFPTFSFMKKQFDMHDYLKARQRKARTGTTLRIFYAECFLTSNICQKIPTGTEQYTKYTRLRKSTNPYLQKDHVRLNWRYIASSGSNSMIVSTTIGTAKKLWHFGLSKNPGNEFWKPCGIFRNILSQVPDNVLQNWPFFSNATTLQSRLSDSSKHRLQEKYFLLSVLEQLEVCQKKVYNKVIWLTKHFYEITSCIFQGC